VTQGEEKTLVTEVMFCDRVRISEFKLKKSGHAIPSEAPGRNSDNSGEEVTCPRLLYQSQGESSVDIFGFSGDEFSTETP
jgi:hypothetical protein